MNRLTGSLRLPVQARLMPMAARQMKFSHAEMATSWKLPTKNAHTLPSEKQGWKLGTEVRQSTIEAAGNGRYVQTDIPTVGTLVCEKVACPFEENNSELAYPSDGVITFQKMEELETYIDYVAKQVPRETAVDVVENFVHGYSKDHTCLNVSTWCVNHSAEPNIEVNFVDGKYQVTTTKPLAAGEELFLDYEKFVFSEYYTEEFCEKYDIRDVRKIALTAAGEEDRL